VAKLITIIIINMKNFQFVKCPGQNLDQALKGLELGIKKQFMNDECHVGQLLIHTEAIPDTSIQGYTVIVNAVAMVVFDGVEPVVNGTIISEP
jgi:hypothetical protein